MNTDSPGAERSTVPTGGDEIERVARAMFAVYLPDCDPDFINRETRQPNWMQKVDEARAAIAVLNQPHKPTVEMMWTGIKYFREWQWSAECDMERATAIECIYGAMECVRAHPSSEAEVERCRGCSVTREQHRHMEDPCHFSDCPLKDTP